MVRLSFLTGAPILPIALVVVAGLIAAARADDALSPQRELRVTVEALVKQLDAQALAERAHAERELLRRGPEILTYLPPPELTSSVSVRESMKRIRVQLERQAARESAQASTVRCSGEATVSDLLNTITAQTRNRVELSPDAAPLGTQVVSVSCDNRSFWECLDDVCNRLKLHAVFNPQKGGLELRPRRSADPVELAVLRNGPFRLAIHSADLRNIVGNSSARLLRISGRLALEPRLRPLFLHFAAADLSASGAEDRKFEPWNPSATYELPVGDAGREVPVQFDYLIPVADRSTTVNLRGRLFTQLAAATERIVFDQTAQAAGTARRRGGVTVRLREVKFEPLEQEQVRAEIKVTVGYDSGGPAFESHRTWMFHNSVYFEDESGKRNDFTDYDTSLQANGAVGVDYRWDHLTGPMTRYHFVYEAPLLILDLPLDIKLDLIPIKAAPK